MSQLIGFLSKAKIQISKEELFRTLRRKMKSIVKSFYLKVVQEDEDMIELFIEGNIVQQMKRNRSLDAINFLVRFSFEKWQLCAELSILDQKGDQIKAETQYQKTMLVKFFSEINPQISPYIFSVNPQVGKIALKFFIFLSYYSSVHAIIEQIIAFYTNDAQKLYAKVAALLEYKTSTVSFIQQIEEKLILLKPLFKPLFELNIVNTKSEFKESHEKIIQIQESNKKGRKFMEIQLKQIKKLKQKFIGQMQKVLFEGKDRVQGGTFQTLNGKLSAGSLILAKKDQVQKGYTHFELSDQKKKEIVIQFEKQDHHLKKKAILTNLSSIPHLVFLFQYIQPSPDPTAFKNESENYFIFRLFEREFRLSEFLKRNSSTLGFEKKLFIMIQLLFISKNITQVKIKDFNPYLGLENFYILPGLKIKMKSFMRPKCESNNLQRQIFSVLYTMLFQKPLKLSFLEKQYYFNLKQKSLFGNLNDESTHCGPSNLLKPMKILCINNYYKSEECISLEDGFFCFIYLWDLYRKMTSMDMYLSCDEAQELSL